MIRLVRSSLWGTHEEMTGQALSHDCLVALTRVATEQAVVGLVSQGLMDSGVRLNREDALNLFAHQQSIRRQNRVMDAAVVQLCQEWQAAGIRILVMKGQTLAALYPDAELRQSGDIDFLVHPEDWEKAMELIGNGQLKIDSYHDHNSEKHVEWQKNGVQYEMHKWLTAFAYPRHHRYWEGIVVPEIWEHPHTVSINGYEVPTLAPTYNVLYTFVHIFYHLILDGIGLRQFCDLAILISNVKGGVDNRLLEKHLQGIGLRKAFTGLGAILTDYLGLPKEEFPFDITEDDHQRAPRLFENMLERGNFGHNVHYKHRPGIRHGLEHLGLISKQARSFYHYAPAEVWWRIPNMFKWWGIKIVRMALRK